MIRQCMNNFYQQGSSQMHSQRTRVGYLFQLMDYVCSNAAYSRFIDEKMLVEWRTYFDICQLIFSELSIKIIKIQENPNTSPAQKLHHLITLLYQELEVEQLRTIDARQVLAFNIEHIHRFLQILYLYSKIYLESKKPTTVVKSETEEKQKQKPAFSSARDNRKSQQRGNDQEYQRGNEEQYHQDEQESTHREEPSSQPYPPGSRQNYSRQQDYLIQEKKRKKKKPTYSTSKKRARSQSGQRKNLHQGIINVIMGEKSNYLRASTRDNRKSRLESVKLAKDSYKMYLTRYIKQNNASFKRKHHLKQKAKAKPLRQQLPQKDFQVIDNFFESFAYRFRDKKAAYLQRIQRLVRQQQFNRFLHQNRLQRELKQSMNSHLEGELKNISHQHRVRSALLRQTSSALDQNTSVMTKAIKHRDSMQRRELRQAKKQQLKAIQNALRQQNQKALMSLQEGGRLEQIILQMYKKI